MKKLILLLTILCASIAGYSQMNTFGGIGLRVNDTTTYQTNAAAYHTAGYYDIYFNNQATNDHWDVWNGSSYDHVFDFNDVGGGTPGGSDTQVQFNSSGSFGGDADFTFTGGNTLNVDVAIVDAETYGSGWNGDNSVPTKNDTYDYLLKYVIDQATPSTAGGTITLDMNSQIQRSHVGSASFSTPKTLALSNTTNALSWQFTFTITDVAAVLTVPSDWGFAPSSAWDGTDYTFSSTGRFVFGGDWDGTNWNIKVAGPFSN